MLTQGENYGRVISEAIVAGCSVLIVCITPWYFLEEKGVGWDISLDHADKFRLVLQQCIDMDVQTYSLWSKRARDYGVSCSQIKQEVDQNRFIF